MIILFEGIAGSGKTLLLSRMVRKEWKRKREIYSNFPLWYDEDKTRVKRWYALDETYHLKEGVLVIDEGQKFFDARDWFNLPKTFRDLLSEHRHHFLDVYTTTQNARFIDYRVRANIHEVFKCQSIFRFPGKQRHKPLIQIIRATHRRRIMDENDRITWEKDGRSKYYFISKLWTRTYYDTYGKMDQSKFVCKVNYQRKAFTKKGLWRIRIINRDLLDRGRKRI